MNGYYFDSISSKWINTETEDYVSDKEAEKLNAKDCRDKFIMVDYNKFLSSFSGLSMVNMHDKKIVYVPIEAAKLVLKDFIYISSKFKLTISKTNLRKEYVINKEIFNKIKEDFNYIVTFIDTDLYSKYDDEKVNKIRFDKAMAQLNDTQRLYYEIHGQPRF